MSETSFPITSGEGRRGRKSRLSNTGRVLIPGGGSDGTWECGILLSIL